MCVALREDLVNCIEHLAERSDGAIHAIHALDGNNNTAFSLPDRNTLVSERTERSAQRINVIVREGTTHMRRDPGYLHTVMHGGVDGLVIEQGVARLRYAREEARVGVEARVKKESRGGAECLRETGFKCGVLRVVYKDTGATGTENFWCRVESGEDACAEERTAREGEVIAGGEVDWGGGPGSLGRIGESGQVVPAVTKSECCDELSGEGRLGHVWSGWQLPFASGNYLRTVAWHRA